MQKTTVRIRKHLADDGVTFVEAHDVDRWVCNRSHPHPTSSGAEACEAARAGGASDAELYALFDAEVAAFNAAQAV